MQGRSCKVDKVIFDITPYLVDREIKNILHKCHSILYQKAFSLPDLYQELMIYVLNRVPVIYTVVEENQKLSINSKNLYLSIEEKARTETIIYQGIHDLLPQSGDDMKQDINPLTRGEVTNICNS